MTDKETIAIRMAREAGLLNPPQDGLDWSAPVPKSDYLQRLERFADLVAAAEREACAKVAEAYKEDCYAGDLDWYVVKYIVDEIKARGKE
jgi:hypothetical protein